MVLVLQDATRDLVQGSSWEQVLWGQAAGFDSGLDIPQLPDYTSCLNHHA